MIAGLVAAFFATASAAFAANGAKASFKFGGGMLYNARVDSGGKSLGGGQVAVDFNVSDKPVSISPFWSYFRQSGRITSLGGLDILVKPKMGGDRASVYFGVGGGVARLKYSTTVMQTTTQTSGDSTITITTPVRVTSRPNKALINVTAGMEVRASQKVSFFVEPRYVWAASSMLNGLTANAGLAFHLR
jgi:opacity protein-like surface antigen